MRRYYGAVDTSQSSEFSSAVADLPMTRFYCTCPRKTFVSPSDGSAVGTGVPNPPFNKSPFLPLQSPAVVNYTNLSVWGAGEEVGGSHLVQTHCFVLRNELSVGNWDVERLRELHSWTSGSGNRC